MSEVIAKPVVKNKFWIVESKGTQIGNIQATEEGGVVYVHNDQREQFASIKLLSQKYNIIFAKADPSKKVKAGLHDVYGFPISSTAHNQVLDVQRYLPIYTKTAKSKSFYCAGHYLVKLSNIWSPVYCPKLITLNRYEYSGPFKTKERTLAAMAEANAS